MLNCSQIPHLIVISEVEKHCRRNKQERREQMAKEQPPPQGGQRAQPPPNEDSTRLLHSKYGGVTQHPYAKSLTRRPLPAEPTAHQHHH